MKNAYQLDYLHQTQPDSVYCCFEWRKKLVVMYRHAADCRLGETEDSFTVRDALTGEFYGAGDTKLEANSDAQYRLMDQSRNEYARQSVNPQFTNSIGDNGQ